jgi:hypothetical protein
METRQADLVHSPSLSDILAFSKRVSHLT